MASLLALTASPIQAVETNARVNGYRGIWFSIGQANQWGPKYSGGLGTYTANHVPIAIYAPAVDKTFFVYGGEDEASGDLLIMASWYDHTTCEVPRPVVVYHKVGVNDPHDNAALLIDRSGYLWVFISGRAAARPGYIYRSTSPYSIDAWELKVTDERTYPQPWYLDDGPGDPLFLHMFTKYTAGRELYWATSTDGINWGSHHKMAGFGGHYQTSCERGGKIATAFNYHPGGNVDLRTNLYYLQTTNRGQSWTTAAGATVTVPLSQVANSALLVNYQAQGLLCYINDTNLDDQGRPYILYITSQNFAAGPGGAPRTWRLARWTGQQWVYSTITESDHNYDVGSLYIEGNTLRIIAPTQNGPQLYGTGGEVAQWLSHDLGATWTKVQDVTTASRYNHSYVRRPRNARDPFYAYWADGHALQKSESRLYFSNRAGTHVWRLPRTMLGDRARPERVTDFGSPAGDLLWKSSFETRATAAVANGQVAAQIANAVGLPGTPVGSQPLTYSAYGQSGTGSPPSTGAQGFALSLPDSRTVGINTGLTSNAGNLAQALTFEGFFRTPQTDPITAPTFLGRRLVTQKQAADDSTRLAIGLHASGSSNYLGVFYKTPADNNIMQLGVTPVLANTWYYFALTYNGTTLRWYLNATLQGTISNPDIAAAGSAMLAVGNLRLTGSSDRGFYGLLDEIRISDRALSTSEFLWNGGSCPSACEQAASTGPLWCSGFEADAGGLTTGDPVTHGLAESGSCGGIQNHVGADGTATGATGITYVAYGQGGVGDAPGENAGAFALSFPSGRSAAIDTHLPSNAGNLAARLTFEGFFNTAEAAPITAQTSVGRRLVTQKRSASDGESRLAIGLHANAGQTANVLAVLWVDGGVVNHMELGTTPIQPNTWYHFALVYNGADLRWYLDGNLEGTANGVSPIAPGSAPITLANLRNSGAPDRGFYGILDEVRISDRVLAPSEFLNAGIPNESSLCYPACPFPFADTDLDSDTDLSDFGEFQACLGTVTEPGCACFDRNGDNQVDATDCQQLLNCLSGAAIGWSHALTPACVP